MKNKFPGACPHCHGIVAAGEGETNKVGDKWVTSHINSCPKPVNYARTYSLAHDSFTDPDGNDAHSALGAEDLNPNEGSKC
jgi:hypothetical protein